MGQRLDRWNALTWHQRRRLAACAVGLACIHASLAVLGYERTRRLVERASRHHQPRPATAAEIADAKALARAIRTRGRVDPVLAGTAKELPTVLGDVLQPEDLVILLGAGDIGGVAQQLADRGLQERGA